jgi:hypothetical protein
VVHAGTSLLRLASTKTTAGAGNSIVATGEHAAAFGISVSTLFAPIFMGLLVVLLVGYLLYRFLRATRHGKKE